MNYRLLLRMGRKKTNFYGPIFLLPVEDKIGLKTQKSVQNRQNRRFLWPWYKLVRQFSLPAQTICHIWLLLRLSTTSCFPPILLSAKNDFLPRLSSQLYFLLRLLAGSILAGNRIMKSDRKPFIMNSSFSRKKEVVDSLEGSQV